MPTLAALRRQAEELAARRDWPGARAAFQRMAQLAPGDADTLLQLSYVESLAGHYRQARARALDAFAAKPTQPDVISELAARLRTFNEAERLLMLVRSCRKKGIWSGPLLLAMSAQLSYLNEQEQALELLDIALKNNPADVAALAARGTVLTSLGRFADAEADLRRCISTSPGFSQPYWLLSRLRKNSPQRSDVAAIVAQLARPAVKAGDVAFLAYALHQELERVDDIPGAWNALEQACRAKRSTLRYGADESRDLVDRLVQWPASTPSTPATALSPAPLRVPVFIVGMHRSGTTLLEQLLDGHPQVRGVGELYDFTSQMRYATDHHCRGVIDATLVERAREIDYEGVGAGYLKGMEWRLGKERFFTDKLPSNFLNIGFICKALPGAKILHMVRDPVETCFSNLRELFSDANPYSYDQLELAAYFLQYQRLMRHWHAAFPGRILDVDYASLTRDPETTLRRVTDFCGLSFEPAMLDLQQRTRGVATASAVQVRDRIVVQERPKWLPYTDYLQPMIKALRAGGALG